MRLFFSQPWYTASSQVLDLDCPEGMSFSLPAWPQSAYGERLNTSAEHTLNFWSLPKFPEAGKPKHWQLPSSELTLTIDFRRNSWTRGTLDWLCGLRVLWLHFVRSARSPNVSVIFVYDFLIISIGHRSECWKPVDTGVFFHAVCMYSVECSLWQIEVQLHNPIWWIGSYAILEARSYLNLETQDIHLDHDCCLQCQTHIACNKSQPSQSVTAMFDAVMRHHCFVVCCQCWYIQWYSRYNV